MVKADPLPRMATRSVIGPSTGDSGPLEGDLGVQRPAGDTDRRASRSVLPPCAPHPGSGTTRLPRHRPGASRRGPTSSSAGRSGPAPGVGDGKVSEASKISPDRPGPGGSSRSRTATRRRAPPIARPTPIVRIDRGDFTLRDLIDPVLVGTPSGDLLGPQQPLSGLRLASFSASDQGGGVFRAFLYADGAVVASTIIDANGGQLRPALQGRGAVQAERERLVGLRHGEARRRHRILFLLVITDPTVGQRRGVRARAGAHTQSDRRSAIRPSVPPLRSPCPRASRARAVTRSRASPGVGTITGQIAGAGAGVAVNLLSPRAAHRGGGDRGGDGGHGRRWLVLAPRRRGSVRRLRAGWRTNPPAPRFVVCSKPLDIRVPARSTLKASPRTVRAGSRVRLTGRLLGGRVPARGKLIDVQARELGRWRTFATVRSRASGHVHDALPVPLERAAQDLPDAGARPAGRGVPVRGRRFAGGAGPRAMTRCARGHLAPYTAYL